MKNYIVRPTVYMLTGSMVLGMASFDDDGSPYRDLRDDGFTIAVNSTGPTGPTGGAASFAVQLQNQITGDLLCDANERGELYGEGGRRKSSRASTFGFTDPSSGSTATT